MPAVVTARNTRSPGTHNNSATGPFSDTGMIQMGLLTHDLELLCGTTFTKVIFQIVGGWAGPCCPIPSHISSIKTLATLK